MPDYFEKSEMYLSEDALKSQLGEQNNLPKDPMFYKTLRLPPNGGVVLVRRKPVILVLENNSDSSPSPIPGALNFDLGSPNPSISNIRPDNSIVIQPGPPPYKYRVVMLPGQQLAFLIKPSLDDVDFSIQLFNDSVNTMMDYNLIDTNLFQADLLLSKSINPVNVNIIP